MGSSPESTESSETGDEMLGHHIDDGGQAGDGAFGGHSLSFSFAELASEAEQFVINGGTAFGGSGGSTFTTFVNTYS